MSAKRRIYLIRHGESQSQTGETTDERDPELSARGVAQTKALAPVLKDAEFDTILVSPLRRAWHTFQLSGAKAARVRLDSRLIEHWTPGFYDGIEGVQPPDDSVEPDAHDAWGMDPPERIHRLMDELLTSDVERMLIFGHFGLFRYMFRLFVGLDIYAPHIEAMTDNTAISRLDIHENGMREVRFWNRAGGTMGDGGL